MVLWVMKRARASSSVVESAGAYATPWPRPPREANAARSCSSLGSISCMVWYELVEREDAEEMQKEWKEMVKEDEWVELCIIEFGFWTRRRAPRRDQSGIVCFYFTFDCEQQACSVNAVKGDHAERWLGAEG
jgi:hypothetical protein